MTPGGGGNAPIIGKVELAFMTLENYDESSGWVMMIEVVNF